MEVVAINHVIPISSTDSSQIGHARRQAASLALSIGFGEVRLGELSIIVVEAARNIATHANAGYIILSPWVIGRRAGVDVFAVDRGKGIPDIDQACEDGFSTAGTPGQGLGAMSRLAGKFQIYSVSDVGTILFARVFRELKDAESNSEDNAIGVISIPISGESVCGDAWSASHDADRSIYVVADGLGHGPFAAEAAQEAVRIFNDMPNRAPEFILREIHRALAKTRGAAVSIAEILHREGALNYAGAGNVSAVMHSGGKSKSVVSMNGTVGHSVAKFQQFSYPWEKNSLLIMHSDGLTSRWNVEQYSGLASRHPALIAAILYRDFSRGRDDATVLVTRR
jgi:anti-sigma regulatory factor (Ser/Thr protein kinase)/serine/threonine protein phosphatase PrpC